MSLISTFQFQKEKFSKLKEYHYGMNWPVVYFIENWKEWYVGQTTSVFSRSKQHYERQDRSKLDRIHIITDDEYNLSAVYDIESWLIQYLTAEGKFVLQNGNGWLKNHNYYDKEKYRAKFETIWKELQKMEFATNDLIQIENSDTFKYSPYKALTEEQLNTSDYIIHKIIKNNSNTFIVNGWAGTWKTVLATYMIKQLISNDDTKDLKVALVIWMTWLRSTIKKVFQSIKWGLKSSMVIWPNDVTKENYDILIIDEAHRLKRRQNLTNYKSFDDTNKKLGFDNEGTELDWIMKSSKHQIFLYDSFQSVKPTDVLSSDFDKLNAEHLYLKSQLRVSAGDDYIDFVHSILTLSEVRVPKFKSYDFQVIDDIDELVSKIKQKDAQYWLSRVVAWYSWDWKSKKWVQNYDIEIWSTRLKWNSTNIDWVNSPNSINEVWCIHTIQWYDLNYVWVIIWNEISYDDINHKIIINREHYRDTNGYRWVTNEKELKQYILNIYKTLLTRWIKWTYIYVCDSKLKKYIKDFL